LSWLSSHSCRWTSRDDELDDEAEPPRELLNDVTDLYEAKVAELHAEHAEQIEYLATEVAARDPWLEFERIYRVIYGSQIAALRSMRATPAGVPRAILELHLTAAKGAWTAFPSVQAQTFETWFAWADLGRRRDRHTDRPHSRAFHLRDDPDQA